LLPLLTVTTLKVLIALVIRFDLHPPLSLFTALSLSLHSALTFTLCHPLSSITLCITTSLAFIEDTRHSFLFHCVLSAFLDPFHLSRLAFILLPPPGPDLLGCVKLIVGASEAEPEVAELGMLAVAEHARRRGLGKALMDAAEEEARRQGCTRLQLQLLHPKTWEHPVKEFLKIWYASRGFAVVESLDFAGHFETAKLLAGPVHFDLYEKPL